MVPKPSENSGIYEATPKDLHHEAVFNSDGLKLEQTTDLLIWAKNAYDNPFDKARTLRDLGKIQATSGLFDSNWERTFDESISLLEEVGEKDGFSPKVEREIFATDGMYYRMVLKRGLIDDNIWDYIEAAKGFEEMRLQRDSVRPDQYEVNFAAARSIAETYANKKPKAALSLARAAIFGLMSESVFVQNRAGNIPYSQRLKARVRATARSLVAATVFLTPDRLRHSKNIRQKVNQTL